MLRTLIPAISAASIQLSFFVMAFKMTSCSFIIHSSSRAGMGWLTLPASTLPALDRTTHVLITPDNSHANDIHRGWILTFDPTGHLVWPIYPHNPYTDVQENSIDHAVGALSVPLRLRAIPGRSIRP